MHVNCRNNLNMLNDNYGILCGFTVYEPKALATVAKSKVIVLASL